MLFRVGGRRRYNRRAADGGRRLEGCNAEGLQRTTVKAGEDEIVTPLSESKNCTVNTPAGC